MHINFEVYIDDPSSVAIKTKKKEATYPICIKLDFSTGPFGFSTAHKKNTENKPAERELFLELTKFKFWLKMTLGNRLVAQGNNNINNDDSNTNSQQLLNFVTGSDSYDFNTIKSYLISTLDSLEDESVINHITACQNEEALLQFLRANKKARNNTYNNVFTTIAAHDPKILQGGFQISALISKTKDENSEELNASDEDSPKKVGPLLSKRTIVTSPNVTYFQTGKKPQDKKALVNRNVNKP